MIYFRLCLLGLLLGGGFQAVQSQSARYTTANAHAHNDYEHPLPFYEAYARQFGSSICKPSPFKRSSLMLKKGMVLTSSLNLNSNGKAIGSKLGITLCMSFSSANGPKL